MSFTPRLNRQCYKRLLCSKLDVMLENNTYQFDVSLSCAAIRCSAGVFQLVFHGGTVKWNRVVCSNFPSRGKLHDTPGLSTHGLAGLAGFRPAGHATRVARRVLPADGLAGNQPDRMVWRVRRLATPIAADFAHVQNQVTCRPPTTCSVSPHIRIVCASTGTVLGTVAKRSLCGCVEPRCRFWRVLAGPSPAYTFFPPLSCLLVPRRTKSLSIRRP
jgi:hypothetical protein